MTTRRKRWSDVFFVNKEELAESTFEVCAETREKGVTARLIECRSHRTAQTICDLLNSKKVRICYDAGWDRKGRES